MQDRKGQSKRRVCWDREVISVMAGKWGNGTGQILRTVYCEQCAALGLGLFGRLLFILTAEDR